MEPPQRTVTCSASSKVIVWMARDLLKPMSDIRRTLTKKRSIALPTRSLLRVMKRKPKIKGRNSALSDRYGKWA